MPICFQEFCCSNGVVCLKPGHFVNFSTYPNRCDRTTKREKEIRLTPDHTQSSIREEMRAEILLKDPTKSIQKTEGNPIGVNGAQIFEELTEQCAQKLYAYLGEERRELNPDLIKRVDLQAEKAANFIFHAHTLKGTQPTIKETEHFLLRSKYELNRIPEIREELIYTWKEANSYKGEKDELIAHLIAERQASIEGRMFLEAKQRGLTPSTKIPELAQKEIKQNNAEAKTLAEKLIAQQKLSESAATFCAKDIARYLETHGQKPTTEQISAMAHISKDLDKQAYDPSIGSHNIEYLRRRDGDLGLRDWSVSQKDLTGFKDFPHSSRDYVRPQIPVESNCAEKFVYEQEKNSKIYEVDFSM